jgi:hypothetical protein
MPPNTATELLVIAAQLITLSARLDRLAASYNTKESS